MSPQAADPQEPFLAIAEKLRSRFAAEWENGWQQGIHILPSGVKIQWDSVDLVERAIRLTVEATRQVMLEAWATDAEFKSLITSRLAELLDKEQT